MPRQSRPTKTPSFIVEIPLVVSDKDAGILNSRFEAGRQLYNACLGEAMRRLKLVKQSKKYQEARSTGVLQYAPTKGKARTAAFKEANQTYKYSEYDLHSYCTTVRNSWLSEHIDANTAQKLATRAFNASSRVAFGPSQES